MKRDVWIFLLVIGLLFFNWPIMSIFKNESGDRFVRHLVCLHSPDFHHLTFSRNERTEEAKCSLPGPYCSSFSPILLLLFSVAYFAERKELQGKSLVSNPYIYSLSLAVYCTSWTFYGSVGKAANSGLSFLTIYLGPTLMAALWWIVLRKIVYLLQGEPDHHDLGFHLVALRQVPGPLGPGHDRGGRRHHPVPRPPAQGHHDRPFPCSRAGRRGATSRAGSSRSCSASSPSSSARAGSMRPSGTAAWSLPWPSSRRSSWWPSCSSAFSSPTGSLTVSATSSAGSRTGPTPRS